MNYICPYCGKVMYCSQKTIRGVAYCEVGYCYENYNAQRRKARRLARRRLKYELKAMGLK